MSARTTMISATVALGTATVLVTVGSAASADPTQRTTLAHLSMHTASTALQTSAATESTLRVGSRGTAVKAWQTDLNRYRTGARSPAATAIIADGVFGPQTAAATRDFQRHFSGLAVDGVVGPNTRARMHAVTAGSTGSSGSSGSSGGSQGSGTASAGLSAAVLRSGDSGSRVRAWQERLDLFRAKARKPALPTIAKDGTYGPQTAAATRDLQRYAHISADGVFGPKTLAAYNRLAG